MSEFRTETVACPACGTPVESELAISVDADQRPDLREAILDASLQRQACPGCGASFRVEPAFTFTDVGRGQYIGVWPVGVRPEWRGYAERTRQAFDAAFPDPARPEANKDGARLEPRVVFGWPSLIEKILARQAGIDDRTLELAKVAVLRRSYATFAPGRRELRLVAVGEADLTLGWVDTSSGTIGEGIRVPRTIIYEIEAEPEAWRALRDDVVEGLVVDFQRERLAS